jgi:pilus assembly protein CpaE
MKSKLKVLVFFHDERLRKEYRYIVGKIEIVRIEREILLGESMLSQETLEEVGITQPDVFLMDFPDNPRDGLQQLAQLHSQYPYIPTIAVGKSKDPAFLIESMKLGVKEYLEKPLTLEQMSEAAYRLCRRICDELPGQTSGSVLTFINSKGGSGSTTIVANFAVCLSRTSKKRVLIVDLDTHLGDVADYFGVKDNQYLFQEEPDASTWEDEHINKAIVRHPSTGVDILSLTNGHSRKSRSLPQELKHLLMHLKSEYDYILLDITNSLDGNTVAALDLSDSVFLISNGNLAALRNTLRFLQAFQRLGYAQSKVRVLVNRYSKNDEIDLPQIEKALKFKVFWTIPNDFRSMISSIQSGVPLTATTRTLPLAKALYEMSAQFLGTQDRQQPGPPSSAKLIRIKQSVPKSTALTTLNLSNS